MAYIHGTGSASEAAAQKQAGAALAAEQLAVLDRVLRTLTPEAQAAFMPVFADGAIKAAEAVMARSGKPGVTAGSEGARTAPSVITKAARQAGGKERVAKKIKKKKKKGAVRCYCGRMIGPKDKKCPNPECGRLTRKGFEAGLRKAAAAAGRTGFIAKAAGAPAVRHDAPAGQPWLRGAASSCDPAIRELWQRARYGQDGGTR